MSNYKIFFVLLLVLAVAGPTQAQTHSRVDPPYPRIANYSTSQGGWPQWSLGSRAQILSRYDMVLIGGTVDLKGHLLAQKLRELKPEQIIIAQALNGLFFSDPPEFYLYRSYRGRLRRSIEPGASRIYVDKTTGIDAGLNGNTSMLYAVINNDIIQVDGVLDDSTLKVRSGEDFYAISERHNAGDTVLSPLRISGIGVYPNFSQWCPQVNGQYSWEYLADKNLARKINWGSQLWDGLFHDYFHATLYIAEHTIDMNMNGVNDYTEMSAKSIDNHRRIYLGYWIDQEKSMMASSYPTGANLYGVNPGAGLAYFYDKFNGHLYEGFLRFLSAWKYYPEDAIPWMQQGQKPSTMFLEDFIKEKWTADGKNRFSTMRFGLTAALLYDCYYGMSFGDWYYDMFWYDEFETDLGYPVGNAQTLASGLMVRYFDKGVSVCNPTGAPQVLNAGDLSGTYHRFKGGQDPLINNGQEFTGSITLFGALYSGTDLRGDGVLLFKTPTTCVSNIIVDNFFNNETSPGSLPVQLYGSWKRYTAIGDSTIANNNPFWSMGSDKLVMGTFDEHYGYHAIGAGTGADSAVYKPTIGVAGWYEVSEWHGWHGDYAGSYQEASNVPFKIVANGQVQIRGLINQSQKAGQWNRLGYVYMPVGTTSFVHINNKANGWVIADAFQFHYMGDAVVPDTTPPNAPQNVRILP